MTERNDTSASFEVREREHEMTESQQRPNDTSHDTFTQTRRSILKATGTVSGLTLAAAGSAAATGNTIHFVEYAIYGAVDENSDKNYATAFTNYLPAHFPREGGELHVYQGRLRDKDKQLFESSDAVAWGTTYQSLPIHRTRDDHYSLADATTVAKVNPVLSYREVGNHTQPPEVRLVRNGESVEASSRGKSITVGIGEASQLALESHTADLRVYPQDSNANTASASDSNTVSVTPKVFVRNHGNLQIQWK